MAILPMGAPETEVVDDYRPKVAQVAPTVSQDDTPGEHLMGIGGMTRHPLPDPTVGGVNGSAHRNGFSTGFLSIRQRIQGFTGAILNPPAIRNPVQGRVGVTNYQGKLHAGVENQFMDYVPASPASLTSFVGTISPQSIARGK